ncbi:hypothetical protein SAMN05660662_2290 [Blastococcus aurantiacus]|uniref:LPXTG-motif cell wall anchor domain-containing protein n=1 Tax=Blastococcus aurantiacus TaxID=1550231 RepID=A0A1G7LFM6_9ACTN|nr:hypothetical protein [Blastococcus aurantiacus]SDF48278.1 hypothetical protein SAMN05660662_2290 [Blastococcus aurantiacus]
MSTSTGSRRRRAQLLACAGVGALTALVGTASPAVAADGITVPLEPEDIMVSAVPVENYGGDLDSMRDPFAEPVEEPELVRVPVRYSGTITVDLPAEFDGSAATAELVFDDNEDGIPEATYSSRFAAANPNRLLIAPSAGTVTVTLPADDPIAGDAARLSVSKLTSTLGPAFGDVYDVIDYELGFDPAAPTTRTVEPLLDATSQVPCGLYEFSNCPIPTPAAPGSPVTLVLTPGSALRELGLSDLTGVRVAMAQFDEEDYDVGPIVEMDVAVTGSTARFVLPADTEPGAHHLVVVQETPTGGYSTVLAELTVEARAVEPVVEPAAGPAAEPAAPASNAGLRSNTGVHLPEAGGSDGIAVAAGAGILLMAGVGAAVARGRRRPAAEGGTCEV